MALNLKYGPIPNIQSSFKAKFELSLRLLSESQKIRSNWAGPEMELVPLPRGAKVVAVTHS